MGRFTLNTPWLRKMFPPSELPREGPSIVSDDVQLCADYFGGGYAFREPQQWFSFALITKAADYSTVTIDTMPVDQTVRILALGIQRNVAGNQVVALTGTAQIYSPDLATKIALGDPTSTLIPVGVDSGWPGYFYLWYPRLVPGSSVLRMFFGLGDNIEYRLTALSVAAPRGVAIIA